jgi:hypothetical protein
VSERGREWLVAERTVKQIVPVSGWVYVTYGRDEEGPVASAVDVVALAWVESTDEDGPEDRFVPIITEGEFGEWVMPPDGVGVWTDLITREYFEACPAEFIARAKKLVPTSRIEAGSE